MKSSPSRAAGYISAFLSIAVIIYSIRYIINAFSTGSVPGKLGAVYHAPDYHFYTFTGFAVIGILLGLFLLRLSVSWIRQV